MENNQLGNNILYEMRNVEKELNEIKLMIKKIKIEHNYEFLSKSLKKIKNDLYNFMVNNNIEKFQDIDIKKIMPTEEKKQIKRKEKIEKVSAILEDADDDYGDLAEKIIDSL